uniref:G_PROTEIN_RECEP_F1_2 domain-containing protein n=1 Tax=Angiostrongylus cantonensis TaxID=6313 RepID=A0A0K0D7W4_ANGCA
MRCISQYLYFLFQHYAKKRRLHLKKKSAMIRRSITISVVNLILNLPFQIFRTWQTVDYDSLDQSILSTIEPVCQILYFSQFICNAFYLSTSIYETSCTHRSILLKNGRQSLKCVSTDNYS